MKKFLKRTLAITALAILLVLTNSINVQATLQANQNTQYTKTDEPGYWMNKFRKMEESGQAMGLSETLNDDLTSKTSNNIDVHMMRSTEYGAIAILSASGYGNPSNDNTITTTTGNKTGVIINTDEWENVAGGLEDNIFLGINSRYFDTYKFEDKNSARVGDALGNNSTTNPGCSGWHSAPSPGWITSKSNAFFVRGSSSIFSFSQSGRWGYGAYLNFIEYCRGVAVCGAEL